MTPLARRLARAIAATGPMRVSDFMAACLTDPEAGYYTTRDPLGAGGDFTTAPEISQMFGEMIGLWLAHVWMADGAPGRFTLAELGPGRGTLMADILRASKVVPGFAEAAEIALLEASPALRAKQAEALAGAAPRWVERVEELGGDRPLYVVANEFFDALPVRQFLRAGSGWRERMVGLEGGALAFGLAPEAPDPELDRRFGSVAEGVCVETCPAGEAVMTALGAAVSGPGGAVLAIDYGGWDGTGDTLQAVAGHDYADILATVGAADLTAHVGFRWLAQAAAPLTAPPLATQGAFLERLGITARAQALARGGAAEAVAAQHRRLTHPDEMGTLFKVLALRPGGAAPVPGFD